MQTSLVVFITGASSGIGKVVGEFLVEKGLKVYGTSRQPSHYPDSKFPLLQVDVHKQEDIVSAIKFVIEKEKTLDIFINNAGVGITGPIEETTLNDMSLAFKTNFFGPVLAMQSVMPLMRNQNKGLIINITSIAATMGLPFRGVYSATKAALEKVTEAIRLETSPWPIDIVTLAPGDFATNIANNRFHTPPNKTSPYAKNYQQALDLMNEHVHQAPPPDAVAHAVWKIINTKKRKVHYQVGYFIQKLSVHLKGWLPDLVFEKLLKNHYKL